jgi:hypothetical protein
LSPLRFDLARHLDARCISKSMGLNLRFFARPYPLGRSVDVSDDRLPALGDVDMLNSHLLLAAASVSFERLDLRREGMPTLMQTASPSALMLVVEWSTLPASTQAVLLDALSKAPQPDAEPESETASYPLNTPQARQLIEGVDDKTAEFLRQLVARFDPARFETDACWIDWADAWEIVGVENANAFAKGVHSGIHRRLSNITGAKAKLILVDEKGGTDGDGSYYIDSRQAVHSLREAFRIK